MAHRLVLTPMRQRQPERQVPRAYAYASRGGSVSGVIFEKDSTWPLISVRTETLF